MRKHLLPLIAIALGLFSVFTNPGTRSFAQNVVCFMDQGGAHWHAGSGCSWTVDSGGVLNIGSGGALQIAGTDRTSVLSSAPAAVAAGYKIARGQATTASASDTVVTGLATVVAVICNLDSAPTTDPETASCSIGDQAGSPAAGSILVQSWKTFGGTPAAATTFSKKVNWVAIGT